MLLLLLFFVAIPTPFFFLLNQKAQLGQGCIRISAVRGFSNLLTNKLIMLAQNLPLSGFFHFFQFIF